MTTLYEILQMPRYNDITLLTPNMKRLHIPIQSVEISETPDIAQHIPKRVLLLTTAMVYVDRQEELKELIDSLIQQEAVGIGIKTGRFIGSIDQDIIDYATKRGFPIINIPDNYSLGTVLHQFLNIVWDMHFEEINFALDIQKQLSDLLFQEASYDVFISNLSQMIKIPIVLLNPFFEIISYSHQFNPMTQRPDHAVHQVMQQRLSRKDTGLFRIQDRQGNPISISLIPVYVHSYYPHYLMVFHPEQMVYPISNFALDQAVLVLSYLLFKNDRIAASRYTAEAQHFREVLELNQRSTTEELHLPEQFHTSDYYQLIHVYDRQLIHQTKLSPRQEEHLVIAFRWLHDHIDDYFDHALVFQMANSLDIFILIQEEDPTKDEQLLAIQAKVQQLLELSLVFSIGNYYSHWQQLQESYTQALLVFDERKAQKNNDPIIYYKNKGMFHLFNQLNSDDIEYFCHSMLKELTHPKDSGLRELRKTLTVYLDNQCEIASTAQELFVHRNTVKYRIERCEELLQMDVSQPENSLNLRLALSLSDRFQLNDY